MTTMHPQNKRVLLHGLSAKAMSIRIVRYTSEWSDKWNEFNRRSKNGTFIFDRNYMDYHSDRFTDNSLIVLDETDRIKALLPACSKGETVISHGGLTYGGWITNSKGMDASIMLEVWQIMTNWYRNNGIKNLIYKPVPWIYPSVPADDDLYAIFRFGGRLRNILMSTAVDLINPIGFNSSSRNRANHARNKGYYIIKSSDYKLFWEILEYRLESRHNARPVHSLDEITMLAERFPRNIELWTVHEPVGSNMLAGCVIFNTGRVAHAQYTAASPNGLCNEALPLLFQTLIAHYKAENCRYFDFGTSNEQEGKILNNGLIEQKQQFGGRSVAYQSFEINIS